MHASSSINITNSFRFPNNRPGTRHEKFTSTDFRYAALFAADALKRHPALAKNRNEKPVSEGFM
jgi:hypothetical protein